MHVNKREVRVITKTAVEGKKREQEKFKKVGCTELKII